MLINVKETAQEMVDRIMADTNMREQLAVDYAARMLQLGAAAYEKASADGVHNFMPGQQRSNAILTLTKIIYEEMK